MRSEQEFAQFDHHDPVLMEDPYPVYAAMRQSCPVAHSERQGGFWAVSRHKELCEVALDPQTYSSFGIAIPPVGQGDIVIIPVETDPPDHSRYRKLLNPTFSPERVATLEPFVRDVCSGLIDSFIDRGHCDLAAELAKPLPEIVMVRILGVPEKDTEMAADWVRRCFELYGHDPEGAMQSGQELYLYFAELMEELREHPAENFLTSLMDTEVDGERLTDFELLGICFQLLLAGIETTYSTIGASLWYLGRHPEERARLVEDSSLVPAAVEELLRYLAQVSVARTVTRDATLGGQQLREGDKLLLLFPSANRDEDGFPDAGRFVVDRRPNRHLAFGVGIHRCLGMHLARMELRVALEEVLRRLPDYRISDEGSIRWSTGHVRGVRSLPVVFTPALQPVR